MIDAAFLNNLSQENLNTLLFSFISNSSDGIALIAPDFKIRFVNGSFERIVGATTEKIIGSALEWVLPGWPRQMSRIFEKVRRTGKPFQVETIHLDFGDQPKGSVIYYNVLVSPVNGMDGAFLGWTLMLQEVPEKKKETVENENLFKEMESQLKFLKKIIQDSPAGILLLDGASLTVKWVNREHLAFSDIQSPLNEFIGNSFTDYLPQAQKGELLGLLQKVAITGEPVCLELLYQSGKIWNCNVIPISTETEVPDLMITTYDISEPVTNKKRMFEYARQAENNLHQLETIIENMEDGIVIFDLNGKIIKQNIVAVRLLGYGNFQDCPDNIFTCSKDFKLTDLDGNIISFKEWPLNRVIRGEVVRNFEAILWKISDGQIRYLSFNGTLIRNSNQTSTFAVMSIRDITDREKLLRELEQEHRMLQTVLEQVPCGVIMFDARSLKRILVNKKYSEIWRVPNVGLALVEKDQPGDFFHSQGRPYCKEELPIYRSLSYGVTVSNEEITCQRKDGSIFTAICNSMPIFDRDRNIVAGVLAFNDITELKEATTKAALANQLQQIIEFLPDGIFVVDQERKVIAWNRAIEVLTGLLKEDVVGTEAKAGIFEGFVRKLIDIIFDGLDHDTDAQFEKNGEVFSKQVLLASLNQRENVLLDIKATPIWDEHGAILSVIETVRDITNQKKLENETIRMQKLESLGILAGGIAHDFNNILAAILANLQLAAIKLQKHQDIAKYLENTIETTKKASCLTKQLLTFARGGIPIKKSISISKLVKDTVQFALSGSNVKAVFFLPEDLWLVDADEGQITQVINNLAINAEQAMPNGGVLEIYGENVIYQTIGKYEPGRYVKLTVKDHGVGIPQEIIHQIFDPFFTTKSLGSGLGLSTSYSIVKKHNGYLEVESSLGNGSIFTILLSASNEELIIKESPEEINAGGEAKILLMDDEDIIRNVSGEMLTFFGYRVMLARDGREAIKLYQKANEIGDPFAAVIMDLTIPGGMGGLETMIELRRINPEIKAIVSSGYANDPVISDYERYGFGGVVIKPYKFDDLIAVLNKVIEKRQLPLDLSY